MIETLPNDHFSRVYLNFKLTKKSITAIILLFFSLSVIFASIPMPHQSNMTPMTNTITKRKEDLPKELNVLLKSDTVIPQAFGVDFSTFFTSTGNNSVKDTTVDNQGNIYITGWTNEGLPVKNSWDNSYNGNEDAFLAKFSSSGYLLFSTYFGGSGFDEGEKVVVDNSGNMYIYGTTSSVDLPMKNAYQGGLVGITDTFIAKFNATGQLMLSTYFGDGGEGLLGLSIAVDNSGNIFVVGNTNTPNFPLKNAAYKTKLGDYSTSTAFFAKFDSQGDLLFSTYLGGAGDDLPYSIALDSNDTAYIVGQTNSQVFPLSNNAFSTTRGAINGFLAMFTSSGSLKYSTYLGAGGLSTKNYPHSVVLDGSGNIYITGSVTSPNLPTTNNAFNASYSYSEDAYVLKFSPSMTLLYGSYVGGSAVDEGWSIQADASGNMFIAGVTYSADFPTKYAIQGTYKTYEEAFVTELFANGSLAFSTFYSGSIGGPPLTECRSMVIDKSDNIIFAGYTDEQDFPTSNAYYPMDRATGSGFLVKFYNGSALLIIKPIHILTSSTSSSNNSQNSTTNTTTQSPLLPDNVVNNPVFEGIAGTMAISLIINFVFVLKRRK